MENLLPRGYDLLIASCIALALTGCAVQEQLLLPQPEATGGVAGQDLSRRARQGVKLGEPPDPGAREPSYLPGTGRLVGTPNTPGPARPPGEGEGVTLNLAQASIAAAAKAVIADTLGKDYVVSDKVAGTITLQTPQPVTKERLLEMFEIALQSQSAAIVVSNGIYRILPIEEAFAAGPRVVGGSASAQGTPGMTTQVVQLRYVTAHDMERLLKSVAPSSSIVRFDHPRNLAILTGSQSDIAAMKDAISVFDVDWMRGMSFAMFPVESADPEALAQELDTIFANERDRPDRAIVRFIPNRRLKSVLIVSARMEHLKRAEVWIRKLDMVGLATEKQVHVYHVQNRPAPELAQLLQRVYASQEQGRAPAQAAAAGPAPAGSTQLQTPLPGVAAAEPAALRGVAPPAITAPPAPGESSARSPLLDSAPGPAPSGELPAAPTQATPFRPQDDRISGITVVADEANNSLVITATANEYRRVRQILSRIDVAPSQVLLEATIAEVTLNDELKLGVRWYFQAGQSRFRLTDSPLGTIAPVVPGFSYFLNGSDIKVVLNALSSITNVNVVSSPTLMVLDNKKAVLQVGDEVPVATQSAVSVISPGAPIVNSVSFRNTGIILGITPRISDNGRILLEIEQEASDVVKTTSSSIDSPTIQQRRVRTSVAVANGESIMLAGLIQDKATRDRGQVPILGEMPVVGNLFKNKTDTIRRTELLIAITPRIVNDRHQVRGIVDEFRDKLNFNTRPQRERFPDRREQLDRLQR
ncbi:MAG: type II secretion system secretin GspD [Hyphomicrobiaceae bacterium]|nr:type II secretion system secretin GspD [Hyphomicrobiaceae bacterium]